MGVPMKALRILIADDNATIRKLLRERLESEPGCIVCGEAVDGQDAVEKAVEFSPDVVLLDMSMPKLDGWQACKSTRAKVPGTKVLLVTEQDPDLMSMQFPNQEHTVLS
jgi:CheY-like chemotaxis protein